ncbi:MAG: peroxiredoxin [Acidilobaceae archaeon]
MSLKVGDIAPDFELYDTDFKLVRLKDLLGRGRLVILAFFPAAFSPTCTNEMCAFRDRIAILEKANAIVVGISVDSPFALRRFKEENRLGFPLLSDYNREVIRAYNVYHEQFPVPKASRLKMVAKRSVFILSPYEGKIEYVWVSDDPSKEPNYEEIDSIANELSRKLKLS